MPTLPQRAIHVALRALLPTCCAALAGPALAARDAACADAANRPAAALELRVDNDIFGGNQDQGYSNGVLITATSSDLSDIGAAGGGCHWAATRWLARHLGVLKPEGSDRQHLSASFAQAIFTPNDRDEPALIADDRPYAAALLLGLGYSARSGDRLQTSSLQLGIVGPSARGEQAQNGIHELIGDDPFRGWNNQLRDEGVFRVTHERQRRHVPERRQLPEGAWRWDGISHWGVSVGNLATYLDVGGEMRWGPRLPDDFGTSPVRPAGVRAPSGTAMPADAGFRAHGFASVEARWVMRDISLDGNTFKRSHRVDKQPLVAEFGYGLAMTHGAWKVVIARYHRTREFRGQKERPIFGSISVSRAF